MTPADRSALVDRLARARAWNRLTDDERAALRRHAADDLTEVELTDVQMTRIGWMLVEPAPAEGEGAET
jgi:hypothetical protein